MPRQVYSREVLARLRARGNDGTFLDSLERAVHAANVSEILRLPTARKAKAPRCQPSIQRSEKKTESSDDTSSSQVIVTLPPTTEWQYRGRTGAEIQVTQPIQGPPDVKTQKDEGFQRFFKAVSSPGHIRVTAGGRIVPNTRGPTSPSHRKDPPHGLHPNNPNGATIPSNQNDGPSGTPAQVPATITPHMQPPSGFPAAYPGYPAGLIPPHIPMAPISWGYHMPPGYTYPPGMAYPLNGRAGLASAPDGESVRRGASGFSQASDGTGGVRISPPKQFDPIRPFFVNGQWVMPLAYPPYVVPPMMPPPSFYGHPPLGQHQAQDTAPASGSTSGSASNQATNYPNPGSQNLTGHQSQNAQPASSARMEAPSNPPISSIRPSQITKSHVESLRQNLKRVEDQLQYNVHQIDVKHMESLAREIRDSIRALEQALPRQLEFEEMHYPKADSEEPKPNGELFNPLGMHRGPQHNGILSSRKRSSARAPISSAKHGKTVFSLDNGFQRSVSSDSDASRNFSGLLVSAAAAPPFQPSSQLVSSYGESEKGTKEAENARIMSPTRKNTQGTTLGTKEKHRDGPGSPTHMRNGHTSVHPPSSPATVSKGPYLVGYLPPGIDQAAARQNGFLYPRELAPEEIRARHLYWGQAPRSAVKGLPKFDGKDFYPPSPAKSSESGRNMVTGGIFDASRTNTDPFSSGESRNAETRTRATSYSVSHEVVEGSKAKVNEAILNHSNTVRIRRSEDRSSGSKTNDILQMLKKGSTSSAALPGEVTSMTAQGLLPQYTAGNAAASLTPTISHANAGGHSTSPRSTGKVSDNDDKMVPESPLAAKGSENRPPSQ